MYQCVYNTDVVIDCASYRDIRSKLVFANKSSLLLIEIPRYKYVVRVAYYCSSYSTDIILLGTNIHRFTTD
jgi:hypothetical protein